MNSFLSHLFTLLSLILLPCREISPLLSYLFLQSFLTLICLLISPLFFSSDLSPSLLGYHHLIVTSSHRHAITSAQARSHTVTSPLLKLTITPSPHICFSSPSPHLCYNSPSFQSMEKGKIQDATEEEEE